MQARTKTQSRSLVLDEFTPYRLAVAAGAVSDALAHVYGARFNVTVAEWRILANLGEHGPLSAGEVATRSTLDKAKVTRALQRLKARRLISRTTEKIDRRQVRLALTPHGTAIFQDIAALANAWERQLLEILTPTERRTFRAALTKLTQRAQQLSQG